MKAATQYPASKIYLAANGDQVYYKNLCIENAGIYATEDQEVVIHNESIFSANGELYFQLSIQAKNRNSLLIILDKTYAVKISRSGKVKSKKIIGRSPIETEANTFKKNQNCFFI